MYKKIAEADPDQITSDYSTSDQYLTLMEPSRGNGLVLVFSGLDQMETMIRFEEVAIEGTQLQFYNRKPRGHRVRTGAIEADPSVIEFLKDNDVEIEES